MVSQRRRSSAETVQIIHVDDSPKDLEAVRDTLAVERLAVTSFGGKGAYAQATSSPDVRLCIFDVRFRGRTVIRQLVRLAREKFPKAQCMALTNHPDEPDARRLAREHDIALLSKLDCRLDHQILRDRVLESLRKAGVAGDTCREIRDAWSIGGVEIVHVDDSPNDRTAVSQALTSDCVSVVPMTGKGQLADAAPSESVRLCILDVRFRGRTGIRRLVRLAETKFPRAVCLALTNHPEDPEARRVGREHDVPVLSKLDCLLDPQTLRLRVLKGLEKAGVTSSVRRAIASRWDAPDSFVDTPHPAVPAPHHRRRRSTKTAPKFDPGRPAHLAAEQSSRLPACPTDPDVVVALAGWIERERGEHVEVVAWDDTCRDRIPDEQRLLIPKRMFRAFESCRPGVAFRYRVEWSGPQLVSRAEPASAADLYEPRPFSKDQQEAVDYLRTHIRHD